jgi:hypothetical protein
VGPLWNLLSTAPCGHETIQGFGMQNQVLLLCCGTLLDLSPRTRASATDA